MVKIFAHRGYVINDNKENSIESLDLAFQNRFNGVEFDIWFIENQLIVSHDRPDISQIEKMPKFSQYLKYKNKLEYWIDFKNFDELSKENVILALNFVKESLKNNEIDLENVYFAPYVTNLEKAKYIYDKIYQIIDKNAQINAVIDNLKYDLEEYKAFFRRYNIFAISCLYTLIDKKFVDFFAEQEIFAWTVNGIEEIKKLQEIGVKKFASDKITREILEND